MIFPQSTSKHADLEVSRFYLNSILGLVQRQTKPKETGFLKSGEEGERSWGSLSGLRYCARWTAAGTQGAVRQTVRRGLVLHLAAKCSYSRISRSPAHFTVDGKPCSHHVVEMLY